MKIIKEGHASQTPCCMMNKACAGGSCPAWEPVTGGGICGMVPRHHHAAVEAVLPVKVEVVAPEAAPQSQAETPAAKQEDEQHGKRGRPSKH